MTTHRVRNLRLREISSVDRPAQVGAVSVLIKRREDPTTELVKATFREALTGCLLADKVRDAFYKAFENMWEGKDAFRKALVDELAAGGDGTVASTDFQTWLSSLVDQARVAAVAAGAADVPDELNKAFNQAATDWLEKQERDMTIKTKADLTAAIEKAQAAGDKVTVAEVTAIHKAAATLGVEDTLPAAGPLAKAAPAVDPATAAKVERMEKRDALDAPARAHYDALDSDEDRDAFLKLDASGRATELEKAAGVDPVVYTTLDGIDIRKSAGSVMLAMAKGRDEDRRELAKATAQTEDVELEKRAGTELGNVGGELQGKKALLKAVDGIADEPTRASALAVLKAANVAAKGAFVRKGSGAESGPSSEPSSNGPEMSESEAKLDEMAKALAKDKSITFEKAYTEVIQTEEGQELYKRYTAGE